MREYTENGYAITMPIFKKAVINVKMFSKGFEHIKPFSMPKVAKTNMEECIMKIAIRNEIVKAFTEGLCTYEEAREYCAKFGIEF